VELVTANHRADGFREGRFLRQRGRALGGSFRQKSLGVVMLGEQGFDPMPQSRVAPAGAGQEDGTFVRFYFQGLMEQRLGVRAIGRHSWFWRLPRPDDRRH